MLDKSIDGALLALRKRMVRGDGVGLKHVEALLALRGVAMPRVLPPKAADAAKRGTMRRLVVDALRDEPRTMEELGRDVAAARPDISAHAAYRRTTQTLQRLKAAGLVVGGDRRGRWVWRLVQPMA